MSPLRLADLRRLGLRRRHGPRPANGPLRARARWVIVALVVFAAALVARALYLQVAQHDRYATQGEAQKRTTLTLEGRRGNIYDRDGALLASTAYAQSVVAQPGKIKRPAEVWAKLAGALPLGPMPARFASGRGDFLWVQRHISPQAAAAVEALGLEGIELYPEPHRHYPKGDLAGALLGFVDIDGNGREGLEKNFDGVLRGQSFDMEAVRTSGRTAASRRVATPAGIIPIEQLAGRHLRTTLHSGIQHVTQQALYAQVKAMRAADGIAIVMDPRTGDVLAMAQTPSFDPNQYRSSADKRGWRNRLVEHASEPGSTIKPILISSAMDAKGVRPDRIWPAFHGRIRVGRHLIRDTHRMENNRMTTLEIIQHSSNVGAIQVAQLLGRETYHSYLRAFGFGETTGLGINPESRGILDPPNTWRQARLATASYGYGISVTAIQMVRAYSALANRGILMRPRLVSAILGPDGTPLEDFPPRQARRVLSAQAAEDAIRGMIMVTQKGGTGQKARIPGHQVAGKTGTSNLRNEHTGRYDKDRYRASFIGFAPAEDPRLVIYVAVDDPREAHYGGAVAAPVFAQIAAQGLSMLGVPSTSDGLAAAEDVGEAEEQAAEAIDPQLRPWWWVPGHLDGASKRVVVPDLRGATLTEAIAKAAERGIRVQIEGSGQVRGQTPQAGGVLAPDEILKLKLAQPGGATL
ncbi:transpeptidase family protein [Myxococcota bacterium]|nr:transpeptidase family protein [Myxococcota bacterium]MBU1897852.1 transpeptidase family protein [Myxococcota bacterium]